MNKEKLIALLKEPKLWIALGIAAVVGIIGLYLLWQSGYTLDTFKSQLDTLTSTIAQYPVAIYIAILLIGGLPLPLSPVLIIGGGVFTELYGLPTSLLICYSAMVLNMLWTYVLARYPLRSLIAKLISRFSDKIPELPDEHKFKAALIIRITPGIPFFLQNYFLGFSAIPFKQYILISCLIQAFYTSGFVISGGAIFEGKTGLAIAGISILIVLSLVFSWLRKRNAVADPA